MNYIYHVTPWVNVQGRVEWEVTGIKAYRIWAFFDGINWRQSHEWNYEKYSMIYFGQDFWIGDWILTRPSFVEHIPVTNEIPSNLDRFQSKVI